MANELTQSGAFIAIVGDSSPLESLSVQKNIGHCIDAFKYAPKSTQGFETLIILGVPFSAILTAVLPSVCSHPMTRLCCAALTVATLAAFLLCRLSIVQTMPKQQVYVMMNMLIAALLFGLTLAILMSEGMRVLHF